MPRHYDPEYKGWVMKQLFPDNFIRQYVKGKDPQPRQKKQNLNEGETGLSHTSGYTDTAFSDFHFTQWKLIHEIVEPTKRSVAKKSAAKNKWWRMLSNFFRACQMIYLRYTDLPLSANYLRALATKLDAMAKRSLTDKEAAKNKIPPIRTRDGISLFGSLVVVTLAGIIMWPITMLKESLTILVMAPLQFFILNPLYHLIYIPLSGFTSLEPWSDFGRDTLNVVKEDVILPLYRIYSNTLALIWDVPISVIIGFRAYAQCLSFPTKYNQEKKGAKKDTQISKSRDMFKRPKVPGIWQLLMGSKNVFLPLFDRRNTKHTAHSSETESLLSRHRSISNTSSASNKSKKNSQ